MYLICCGTWKDSFSAMVYRNIPRGVSPHALQIIPCEVSAITGVAFLKHYSNLVSCSFVQSLPCWIVNQCWKRSMNMMANCTSVNGSVWIDNQVRNQIRASDKITNGENTAWMTTHSFQNSYVSITSSKFSYCSLDKNCVCVYVYGFVYYGQFQT